MALAWFANGMVLIGPYYDGSLMASESFKEAWKMAIGRESGPVCKATCQVPGREECWCVLPPGHIGEHWCVLQNHEGHTWHDPAVA